MNSFSGQHKILTLTTTRKVMADPPPLLHQLPLLPAGLTFFFSLFLYPLLPPSYPLILYALLPRRFFASRSLPQFVLILSIYRRDLQTLLRVSRAVMSNHSFGVLASACFGGGDIPALEQALNEGFDVNTQASMDYPTDYHGWHTRF